MSKNIVTYRKVEAEPWEGARYEASFFGKPFGFLIRMDETRVRCTGGRRYGNHVADTYWEYEPLEGRAANMHYGSRKEACVGLLTASLYPGRENIARKFAR